ncbi:hypothetical protein LguiA_008248 [Lonicera macranthoides]
MYDRFCQLDPSINGVISAGREFLYIPEFAMNRLSQLLMMWMVWFVWLMMQNLMWVDFVVIIVEL